MAYVAFLPTCGPILILSPFVWGSPRMQGIYNISAHLWANSDFVVLSLGIPKIFGGYVAFAPTCGPSLILFLFVWGSPRMQGLCSISAHLWAKCDFGPLYLGIP